MFLGAVGTTVHNNHQCCCYFQCIKWRLSVQGFQTLRVFGSTQTVSKRLEVEKKRDAIVESKCREIEECHSFPRPLLSLLSTYLCSK
jgi:hypothetical protein